MTYFHNQTYPSFRVILGIVSPLFHNYRCVIRITLPTQRMLGSLPAVGIHEDGLRVCEVFVVDDGSSKEDRMRMIEAFPRFMYLFKAPGEDQKGA